MNQFNIGEIFNELYVKFTDINDKDYQEYKEPFKVIYYNDEDFILNTDQAIIYYFIGHYINENNIIVKDNKKVLSETIYDKFYDYLYTLGLDISRYIGYKPSKTEYLIKHVISTFIIKNDINLADYINKFKTLHSKDNITINNSIDIVNYFTSLSNRPWKGYNDYLNEFMDFFEKLDDNYARPYIVNMIYNEVSNLVKEYFNKDIISQSEEVQKLYLDNWSLLYANNELNNLSIDMIYYDFVIKHYKQWKTKFNYEYEWKDYIETLNID